MSRFFSVVIYNTRQEWLVWSKLYESESFYSREDALAYVSKLPMPSCVNVYYDSPGMGNETWCIWCGVRGKQFGSRKTWTPVYKGKDQRAAREAVTAYVRMAK